MAEEDSKVTFIYLYVNFLYHDSAVTQGDNLPLEGIPTGQKYKHEKNLLTLTFTYHNHSALWLRHSLDLVLQERCNQTGSLFILSIIIRLVTPRTSDNTPLLPAESHGRCPIPLCTASKV